MARCVIVGGAGIGCYQRIRDSLREDDWFVYCDGGLNHQRELGRKPDLIVGDFDSHERPVTDTETIVLPREKDDTDTVYAVKEAIRRGFRDFLLIGVTGERFDHTFGNVSLLLYLDSQGIPARILDDYSEMSIVSRKEAEVKGDCSWFSLLNISGTAIVPRLKDDPPKDRAKIHAVTVVPMLAPMITATAVARERRPAFTKLTSIRVVAVEDCTRAVTTIPVRMHLKVLEVILAMNVRNLSPAIFWRPPLISDIP